VILHDIRLAERDGVGRIFPNLVTRDGDLERAPYQPIGVADGEECIAVFFQFAQPLLDLLRRPLQLVKAEATNERYDADTNHIAIMLVRCRFYAPDVFVAVVEPLR